MIRNPHFIKRKIGTRDVIVAVGEEAKRFPGMLSVNRTGSVIWDLLEQETDLEKLTDALAARYEIDRDTAKKDAEEFLDALRGVGALVDDRN